jgi:chromosome segregation ATPase
VTTGGNEPEQVPPRPWPEDVRPSNEELADWLGSMTREQLVATLDRQRLVWDQESTCFERNHEWEIAELRVQLQNAERKRRVLSEWVSTLRDRSDDDGIGRDAEVAGFNEAVKRYVAELKSAYQERDAAKEQCRRYEHRIVSLTQERDVARESSRECRDELDVMSLAEVDRDAAVRADERRNVLGVLKKLYPGVADHLGKELALKRRPARG